MNKIHAQCALHIHSLIYIHIYIFKKNDAFDSSLITNIYLYYIYAFSSRKGVEAICELIL